MQHVSSYGIIPLQKIEGEWFVFLISHQSASHWSFPKGHGEPGESPKEAAIRELKEETGLSVVKFLTDTPLIESYQFYTKGERVYKTVSYFLAAVEGEVALQVEEIAEGKWVKFADAEKFVTFSEAKSLCTKAKKLLAKVQG